MLNELKNVAKFFFYTIRRIFVTINSTINKQLHIEQQTVAVDDKNLHYYIRKKKVVIQKEKIFVTGVLASSIIDLWIVGEAK